MVFIACEDVETTEPEEFDVEKYVGIYKVYPDIDIIFIELTVDRILVDGVSFGFSLFEGCLVADVGESKFASLVLKVYDDSLLVVYEIEESQNTAICVEYEEPVEPEPTFDLEKSIGVYKLTPENEQIGVVEITSDFVRINNKEYCFKIEGMLLVVDAEFMEISFYIDSDEDLGCWIDSSYYVCVPFDDVFDFTNHIGMYRVYFETQPLIIQISKATIYINEEEQETYIDGRYLYILTEEYLVMRLFSNYEGGVSCEITTYTNITYYYKSCPKYRPPPKPPEDPDPEPEPEPKDPLEFLFSKWVLRDEDDCGEIFTFKIFRENEVLKILYNDKIEFLVRTDEFTETEYYFTAGSLATGQKETLYLTIDSEKELTVRHEYFSFEFWDFVECKHVFVKEGGTVESIGVPPSIEVLAVKGKMCPADTVGLYDAENG